MRHYKSKVDACYGAVLLIAALVALSLSCATIDYVLNTNADYAPRHPIYYPFACLFVFAFLARWQLLRSGIRWWVYLGLLIPTLYAALFMTGWFRDELHDFALMYFESHGKFGCHDERYASYIFRDDTAPWILFGPFVLATVSYWLSRSPAVWAFAKRHIVSFLRWSTTYETRRAA
jgi:hypothetical protein